ncbi:hypothetical protein VNO77_44177 [Canavalia gladiata]|uniref:Uncharacterized protein n=1 Tax=Canavalia gladiata TaxID=3824 RepID=A0AAN9JXK9_CANGL
MGHAESWSRMAVHGRLGMRAIFSFPKEVVQEGERIMVAVHKSKQVAEARSHMLHDSPSNPTHDTFGFLSNITRYKAITRTSSLRLNDLRLNVKPDFKPTSKPAARSQLMVILLTRFNINITTSSHLLANHEQSLSPSTLRNTRHITDGNDSVFYCFEFANGPQRITVTTTT